MIALLLIAQLATTTATSTLVVSGTWSTITTISGGINGNSGSDYVDQWNNLWVEISVPIGTKPPTIDKDGRAGDF